MNQSNQSYLCNQTKLVNTLKFTVFNRSLVNNLVENNNSCGDNTLTTLLFGPVRCTCQIRHQVFGILVKIIDLFNKTICLTYLFYFNLFVVVLFIVLSLVYLIYF